MIFLRKGFRKINRFSQAIRPKLVTRNANAAYMRKTRLSACLWALGSSAGQFYALATHITDIPRKMLSGFYEKNTFFPVFAGSMGYLPVAKAIGCNHLDGKERPQAAQRLKKYVNAGILQGPVTAIRAVLPVTMPIIHHQSSQLLCQ